MKFDHTKKNLEEIYAVAPKLEACLMEFGATPHYGKYFEFCGHAFERFYGTDLLKLR